MLSFRQTKLLIAAIVLAAGAVAVPGARGAAVARGSGAIPSMKPVRWSAKKGPVPGALTVTSPALASITFPGAKTADTLLFWAGPRAGAHGYRISDEHAISLSRDKWSPPEAAGKAVTTSAPAAAPYLDDVFTKFTTSDVIVTWQAGGGIRYEIGTGEHGGAVSFGPEFSIPGAHTSASPAISSPFYAKAVLVTWKAAGSSAVDFVVGFPGKGTGPVRWGPVGTIRGAAASSGPAVAEVSTGSSTGRIYVLWRALGRGGRIDYATGADPLSSTVRWSAPVGLPPGIRTSAAPVAQAIGPLGSYPPVAGGYPLLIVYSKPRSSRLLQVTLPRKGPVSVPRLVPFITSPDSPALFGSVLAATDPGQVFYTRPCGGC